MKHLLLGIILVALIPLACQRVPQMGVATTNQNMIHGVALSNNYDTYLNQIIALQKKHPVTNQRILRFPIKVHIVNPLIDTELLDEDFSEVLTYLNSKFLDSNIQFDFVEETKGCFDEHSNTLCIALVSV